MTEALRDLLGEAIYGTLTRGLYPFHRSMLEYRVPEGKIKEVWMVTPEGVARLKRWTAEQIDELSNIGESKTTRIMDALRILEDRVYGYDDMNDDTGIGESDAIA